MQMHLMCCALLLTGAALPPVACMRSFLHRHALQDVSGHGTGWARRQGILLALLGIQTCPNKNSLMNCSAAALMPAAC